MADQQTKHTPGAHYSGHNPIPTVKQFVENLDKDKKNRDKQIDASLKQPSTAQPHKAVPERQVKGTEKTVTDPTTGKDVVIADVSKEMMKEVDNPHLVIPNANLDKPTVQFSSVLDPVQYLPILAHQDGSLSVARRLQIQPRCHSTARPSR